MKNYYLFTALSMGLIPQLTLAEVPTVKAAPQKTTIKSNEDLIVNYSLLSSSKRRISQLAAGNVEIQLKSYLDSGCSQGESLIGAPVSFSSSQSGAYSLSSGSYYLKPFAAGYSGSCFGPINVLNASVPFEKLVLEKGPLSNNKIPIEISWKSNLNQLAVNSIEKVSFGLYSDSSCSIRKKRTRIYTLSPKNGKGNISISSASNVYVRAKSGSILSECLSAGSPGVNFYRDLDNDGFGDINNSVSSASQPSGYVSNSSDCDDSSSSIFPGAQESCSNAGTDNDCDGVNSESEAFDAIVYYQDNNSDGVGDGLIGAINACSVPFGSGYTSNPPGSNPTPDSFVSFLSRFDGSSSDAILNIPSTQHGNVSYVPGISGQALDASSGAISYVVENQVNNPSGSSWTVEMWIKPLASGANTFRYFFALGPWNIGISDDNRVYFDWFNLTHYYGPAYLSQPQVSHDSWHHIALSFDASLGVNGGFRFFQNGNLAYQHFEFLSRERSYAISSPTSMIIGALNQSLSFQSKCHIDNVRISKGIARYTENFTPPINY
jgi:Concanavalin A-like lectin/glucanases superfamily/Putative metal-binding motif